MRGLGACYDSSATTFRVWAPEAASVEVIIGETSHPMNQAMTQAGDGYFTAVVTGIKPGEQYRYRVDGRGPFPDPASRFQPMGVHGPSEVVDPSAYHWNDEGWKGIALEDLVLYELHIGAFTTEGTFRAAAAKLPALRDLGITAVELMPVADFPGQRNWGYDGVAPFAPARCYGTPDDLRSFVDTAHALHLAVFLDVVYNHFGPDGAYQSQFSAHYFSMKHRSPWGEGLNFDGPMSGPVRNYFIENALHWIHEYHMDGLRLDATHAIQDGSERHFLAEIAAAVHASPAAAERRVYVVAEDVRNLAHMLYPDSKQGWGLDAVWSDDFHHQMRRALAGDQDGYFQDFDGSTEAIAQTAKKGWFFCGQYSPFFGAPRGSDPEGIAHPHFVFFLQNHDQIGNRPCGDRLHHVIDLAAYRAASVLLLLLPETPLLFMGQEWAASTGFRYFTDHGPELGKLVTEGRRREFQQFAGFSGQDVPDPQGFGTFSASRLAWEECGREPHASVLRLYRRLLELRPRSSSRPNDFQITAYDDEVLFLERGGLAAVVRLRGCGQAVLPGQGKWKLVVTTEDADFAPDPRPLDINLSINMDINPAGPSVYFHRPGAVVLRA